MKALVFNGPADIRYESFDDPVIRDPNNLIIKVQHCSICGSDLHLYHGDSIGPNNYGEPMARFCTGHETIGEVVEVGAEVHRHKVGDRVLVSGAKGCGKCRRCLAGQINLCESYARGGGIAAYGTSAAINGGHSEYMEVFSADIGAIAIPEGVTDEQAILLTDALSTGYHGVKRAQVTPGDSVAVIGQGPVGRMAAEAALAVGASAVYAVDTLPDRLEHAPGFGAIPVHPDQAIQRIQEDTRGLGADVVIEAVGAAATVELAVSLARVGAHISILGIVQPGTPIPLSLAQMKSLIVHIGVAGCVDYWPEVISLVQAGRIKGEGVFTHHFDLAEGSEAFRMFNAREDNVMKVLLTP